MTQKWRNWTTFQKKYSLQSFICGQYLMDFISKYRNVASDRNENGALVVPDMPQFRGGNPYS